MAAGFGHLHLSVANKFHPEQAKQTLSDTIRSEDTAQALGLLPQNGQAQKVLHKESRRCCTVSKVTTGLEALVFVVGSQSRSSIDLPVCACSGPGHHQCSLSSAKAVKSREQGHASGWAAAVAQIALATWETSTSWRDAVGTQHSQCLA